MQVLGKCQLKEVVQEKENGLDSLGNNINLHYYSKVSMFLVTMMMYVWFSCGGWIELEHGTETAVLLRKSSFEKK